MRTAIQTCSLSLRLFRPGRAHTHRFPLLFIVTDLKIGYDSRVEFLLKTESGYLRDAEVT